MIVEKPIDFVFKYFSMGSAISYCIVLYLLLCSNQKKIIIHRCDISTKKVFACAQSARLMGCMLFRKTERSQRGIFRKMLKRGTIVTTGIKGYITK